MRPYKDTTVEGLAEIRSCVKVEVGLLGSPPLIVLTVAVDVKQHKTLNVSE